MTNISILQYHNIPMLVTSLIWKPVCEIDLDKSDALDTVSHTCTVTAAAGEPFYCVYSSILLFSLSLSHCLL